MIKEGEEEEEERERATVKANILTIFLFNEAHPESAIEFFSSSKSNLNPSAFYSLHHGNRSTRIVREQSRSSIATRRPLKTSLFQFLKVRQALSCARFYLKNVFHLLPSGIFFFTRTVHFTGKRMAYISVDFTLTY
jgi:hypothetical protein